MKKNFEIEYAVFFHFDGDVIDLMGECELSRVDFYPGIHPCVKLVWKIEHSNKFICFDFIDVKDFIVRGRDSAYPFESGLSLSISGFIDGTSCNLDDEFYVEPTEEMSYMAFVMDDKSAFLVKAGVANMRRC